MKKEDESVVGVLRVVVPHNWHKSAAAGEGDWMADDVVFCERARVEQTVRSGLFSREACLVDRFGHRRQRLEDDVQIGV